MNIIAKFLKLICVAALIAVTMPLVFLIVEKQLSVDEPPVKSDVIVVLGCAVGKDGTPTPLLRSRVEKGVALWRAGFAPFILFTGNAVANQWVEAESMANLAATLGVPPESTLIEPRAHDTIENARFSEEIMQRRGWKSLLLVTSPFHTRRARQKFQKLGLQVTTVAAPYPADVTIKERIERLINEHH